MKFSNQLSSNNSDDELEKDEVNTEEENEEEEEDEDDAVDDNEDFIDEKENVSDNTGNAITQPKPLGIGNTKIVLKKTGAKKLTTQKMVDEAIQQLNERGGSSMEAIKKFIINKNPDMVENRLKIQIKRYIKNSLTDGKIVQIKRSFKLSNKHAIKKKPIKKRIKKQGIEAKKEKQKENGKTEKDKQKQQKLEKTTEKKAAKSEKPSGEPKAAAKKQKETDVIEKTKPEKISKSEEVAKGAKAVEMVIPAAAHPKNAKTAAKESKKKVNLPAEQSAPGENGSVAIKAAGRGKKK